MAIVFQNAIAGAEIAMKIVVLDGRPLAEDREAWTSLDKLGDVEFHLYTAPEDVAIRARGAGVLVTNKAPIRAKLIDELPDLRFITMTATGFDCVDVAAARRRGIPVSNVPIYGTNSVAQFVFALLLELCQHVGPARRGRPRRRMDESARLLSAQDAARSSWRARRWGSSASVGSAGAWASWPGHSVCRFWRMTWSPGGAGRRACRWCDLDDLFARADVISLHCPLTPATAGLVNRERLSLVKPTAFLINTARGALSSRKTSPRHSTKAGWPAPRGRGFARADPARQPACWQRRIA